MALLSAKSWNILSPISVFLSRLAWAYPPKFAFPDPSIYFRSQRQILGRKHTYRRCVISLLTWFAWGFHEAKRRVKSLCKSCEVHIIYFIGTVSYFLRLFYRCYFSPLSVWNKQVISRTPLFYWNTASEKKDAKVQDRYLRFRFAKSLAEERNLQLNIFLALVLGN